MNGSGEIVANRCGSCGKPIEALVVSCSRECALAYWRQVQQTHGITVIDPAAVRRTES